MKFTSRKKVLCAFVLMLPVTAWAALYGTGPAESWTQQQLTAQATQVSGNIIVFGETFAAQMQNHFEQTISAIAVATKQESVAANLIASNNLKSSQQLISAVAAQDKADAVAKAVINYSPTTGQGYKTCTVIQKNKTKVCGIV